MFGHLLSHMQCFPYNKTFMEACGYIIKAYESSKSNAYGVLWPLKKAST